MKTNKRYIRILLFLFFPLRLFAQQEVITLSDPLPANGATIYEATKTIYLNPPFSYTANSSASFVARIINSPTPPPENNSPPLHPAPPNNQDTDQNYILTRTYTNDAGTAYLDNIQYFDGLGRPMEPVQKGITPAKADLVSFQEYDAFGRESNAWLPAVASGNNGIYMTKAAYLTKAAATYNSTAYNAAADSIPYSRPVYEASPLNRVLEQYAPGADWQKNGKGIKTEYLTNSGTSGALSCALFTVDGTGVNAKVKKNNFYADAQLYITRITDEDGNISYEFKDKLGRVVLTRQILSGENSDTYYVYDDFGNLCFVLPPLASEELIKSNNVSYDDTDSMPINQYGYIYRYDSRNRCIAKKLPGCEYIYYIYDGADRLIFSQDGENRKAGLWQFSIPDAFGRVVLTGTCKDTLNYSANPLGATVVKTNRSNGNDSYAGYATPAGITLSSPTILLVNYYDDYAFLGYNDIPDDTRTQYVAEPGYDACYGDHQTANAYKSKGLLTGTLAAQLNGDGTVSAPYLYSVMYYDNLHRIVQTKSNNHLLFGGTEKEYVAYNFTGQPTAKKHIHQETGDIMQTEIYAYTYDHAGRLTKETHQLNGGTVTTVAENTYDELGRLKTNKKGGQANLNSTYAYNIRSWTKSISSPLFTETLYYNESYGGSAKRYNGNISAMSWKLSSESATRGYAFSYDNFSRLTAANYLENASANSNYRTSYTYDKGNLRAIERYGKTTASAYGLIDNMTLSYSGYQLHQIEDAVPDILISESADFKNYNNATTEYTYNANGAMTKDFNKGTDIQYNLLNLPRIVDVKSPVSVGWNEYTYSADGKKLRINRRVVEGYITIPSVAVDSMHMTYKLHPIIAMYVKNYFGNIIDDIGKPMQILIDGGYIEGGVYHYYLTDHIGNNRLVVDESGAVVQKNHYYPFGMPFADGLSPEAQPYKYNGKELDQMHGLNQYDYSARYYDPAIAQFTTMDPLCEKYYPINPYAYCLNNPVRYIDPDGRSTHTDSLGNVVAVYNDNNMGVYKHNISADTYDGSGLTADGGTRMGETEYWDEFSPIYAESNTDGSMGSFTIQFGESFDPIIARMNNIAQGMNLIEIAQESQGDRFFDIKKDYRNAGRLLNGKYATSRSAGNFLAAYNASRGKYMGFGISFETFQKLAGALHIEESEGRNLLKGHMLDIVVLGTYVNANSRFRSPTWGEEPYQYRMSKIGWNYGKKK